LLLLVGIACLNRKELEQEIHGNRKSTGTGNPREQEIHGQRNPVGIKSRGTGISDEVHRGQDGERLGTHQ
jgi:hypothetical protein